MKYYKSKLILSIAFVPLIITEAFAFNDQTNAYAEDNARYVCNGFKYADDSQGEPFEFMIRLLKDRDGYLIDAEVLLSNTKLEKITEGFIGIVFRFHNGRSVFDLYSEEVNPLQLPENIRLTEISKSIVRGDNDQLSPFIMFSKCLRTYIHRGTRIE